MTAALLILLRRYRRSTKENLCRYTNEWLLGVIIFIALTIVMLLFTLIVLNANGENPSVLDLFERTVLSSEMFTTLLFPVAVIVSLAISISNLVLMKNEGVCFRNMLGFILGIVLCVGTVSQFMIYPLLDKIGVDVHNYASFVVLAVNLSEDIIAVVIAYLECVLLGTAISAVRAAKHVPAFNKDFILILGCQITKDGGLTKLLQSRTDRAVEFAEMQKKATGRDIIFVPSGGKGDDEVIAEAEAIHNYLVSKGIPEERILVENKSKNTDQNIHFSHGLISKAKENANIAFSTTNYHVFRAGCIADEAGIPMEGIGAKTKSYFWINAFIREFVAALHYEKKNHIRSLLVILAIVIPVEMIVYISFLH
ncbi:MAG: YdcF family protein [Ruminococcus sp.]|nr:YdcF family protein [Ruminococcus sp.]